MNATMLRFRLLILSLALTAAIAVPSAARDLVVRFLDVGQGDSIMLQLPTGGAVLVDAGDPNAGPRVVKALKAQKIKCLDMIVATHAHSDHIGGMSDVLSAFPVRTFLDNGFAHGSKMQLRLLTLVQRKKIKYKVARAGETTSLGGVKFQVLAPKEPLLVGTDSDDNNNSVVLRVTYGKVSFLLPGDMEGDERGRLYSSGADLSATVLKVAHHGSTNGTDRDFVSRVRPKVAVISLAAGNSYGHPHAAALAALTGVPIYRTDQNGTITVSTDGKTYKVLTERQRAGRARPATVGGAAVIGNSNSHKFHRPTCESLPAPSNRVTFSSREKAMAVGYTPCGRCRP